jgi:hypothetical protein
MTQELSPPHDFHLSGTSATNIRRARWIVYQDDLHERWEGQGYATGTAPNYSFTLINPVRLSKQDSIGRVTDQIQATRNSPSGKLVATDSFPKSTWVRWTKNAYDNNQNLAWQRVYFDIPASGAGMAGTHYNETRYSYDSRKRPHRQQTPGGTLTRTVYHVRGWLLETWVGTNDVGATEADPSGGGANGNNMVKVEAYEYDENGAGGNGNRTKMTRYENAFTTRVTNYLHDFRNRQIAQDGELDFYETYTYDNLDRLIQTDRWDTTPSSDSHLRARSKTQYDDRGRVFQRIRYGVGQSSGAEGYRLTDNLWYDPAGNLIKENDAGSKALQKMAYDGAGIHPDLPAGDGGDFLQQPRQFPPCDVGGHPALVGVPRKSLCRRRRRPTPQAHQYGEPAAQGERAEVSLRFRVRHARPIYAS